MTKEIKYHDNPWLKHYDQNVPASIKYKKTCLPDLMAETVSNHPNRTAIIFQGHRLTYQQLNDMVDRLANCLLDFGVSKGDPVAILLPNIIPCVVSYYAALKIGAIVVMNNPLYSDRELAHQFNDSGSKVLITIDVLVNRMIALRPKTKINQIIYTSIKEYLPFFKKIFYPFIAQSLDIPTTPRIEPEKDVFQWKQILNSASPASPQTALSFDDVAMYQYTGGTTGVSKGVMLTHGNLSQQTQQLEAWFPVFKRGGQETILGALPFFHVFGASCVMNLSIYFGWTIVLVPKPQPHLLLESIRKYHTTFVSIVPAMTISMLNHPDIRKTDMTCIRACFSGSAPLPIEVIKTFNQKTNSEISEGFGMTESSPVTHSNPFSGLRKAGSIGIPLPDTQCRIVDLETGENDVPINEVGELIIKGPQVMKGYLNQPDATKDTIKNGWLYTGDIAKMDEDGYFFIVDRKKDMVISGGFNVYPREIDDVLYEHEKVQEACSIGIPHPTRGEQIKAFVVLKKGEIATERELLEYCKTKLAAYKLPTIIEIKKELPKSNVGKILRKDLR